MGLLSTYHGHPLTFIQLICKNLKYEYFMHVTLKKKKKTYWYNGLKYLYEHVMYNLETNTFGMICSVIICADVN